MKNCERGVTLIELLAAISLLSIIVILASSIHLIGQKQMNSQKNEVQAQSQERLAANYITKEIRKAKSDKVVIYSPTEFTINGLDYKFEGTTISKEDENFITNINSFSISKNGNQVTLKIGNLPETIIYIRE